MKITKNRIFFGVLLMLQVLNLLVSLDINYFFIRPIFGMAFLAFVPGVLLMLALKIKKKIFWEAIVYVVGLSVTFLMFAGLITNWVLTNWKISEPLSTSHLIVVFNFFIIILLILAMARNKRIVWTIKLPKLKFIDWLSLSIPSIFPVLAIFGAVTLNNDNFNPYTTTMLGSIALWVVMVAIFGKKLDRNIYPASLFFISLALLFMTSLRGWYTTGHDNQLEYFVFQLTKSDYTWDISEYRDPYNASLSITILPTVFYSLLGINDVYIYKTIFQIIFSLIGVSLFLFFERYTSRFVALLSVFSFISFPTFINDMPMLNRQEIAMFFFSLVLLELFAKTPRSKVNRILFLIFGFSMVVSHYSTTYIAIALFVFVYVAIHVLKKNPLGIMKKLKIRPTKSRLSLGMILLLFALTLLWNVQLTNTTTGLTRVITETYKNLGKTFSQDLKSGGVLYSLFSWQSLDKEELLKDYVKTGIDEARLRTSRDRLYDEAIYSEYAINLVDDHRSPPRNIGQWLINYQIDPFGVNFYLRQVIAKIIQVFMIIGLIVILLRKSKFVKNLDFEYLVLVFASFVTLAIFIVLPVLSIEYGTQRLFQQTLMISSLPMVIGFFAFLGSRISVAVLVTIFLSLSGFIPYITGFYYPQLHLENDGVYYDSYLLHKSEAESMKWLSENYSTLYDIYSTSSSHSKLKSLTGLFSYKNVLPGVLTKEAYVYLDYTNVDKQEDIVSHKGDLFIYKYPIKFLDQNKDLIYSNAETIIYK